MTAINSSTNKQVLTNSPLSSSSPPKLLFKLPELPKALLSKVASFCDVADMPYLSRVNKAFAQTFSQKDAIGRPAAQVLLEQIKGCRTITSLGMLKQQLKGLQRYCPNYLGEGKTWTLAEVIKIMLPSLRAINLSRGNVSDQEKKELFDAFDEVSKIAEPVKEKTIKFLVVKCGELSLQEALSPEDVDKVTRKILPEFYARLTEIQQLGNIVGLMLFIEEYMPKLQAKKKEVEENPCAYATLLQEVFPDRTFSVVDTEVVRKIYGDIQIVNLGFLPPELTMETARGENAKRGLFYQVLKAFCPNLSHITVSVMVDLEFIKDNYLHSIVHINVGGVGFPFRVPVPPELNSPKLEYLFTGTKESAEDVIARAEVCPHLKNAQISFEGDKQGSMINALNRLVENCPNIDTISVSFHGTAQADEIVVVEILKKFKNLKELTIQGYIDEKTILSLLNHTRNLKHLHLNLDSLYTSTDLIERLPDLVPHLETLTLRELPMSWSSIMRLPELKEFSLSFDDTDDDLYRNTVVLLKNLSRRIQKKDCPGRELFDELQKLPPNVLKDVYYFTEAYTGMSNIPDYGRKLLEQDIRILRTFTKPLVSLKGKNLLEQLAWREIERSRSFIYQTKYLDLLEKGDIFNFVHRAYGASMNKITYALWERHGREVSGEEYLLRLSLPNKDSEDLKLVLSILEPRISELRGQHAFKVKPYNRVRLETFLAIMKDESVSQHQLLAVFRTLAKDVQDKLTYSLWEASGKPQEEGFADKTIEANVRSLRDVVASVIASEFNYLPDPKKPERHILDEFLRYINDGNLSQTQLLDIFNSLNPDLKDKLAYDVWLAHNRDGNEMIREDVRCLRPIIYQGLPLGRF